ncbi:cobalamin-binding protein [Alteromonas sp. D210916BOD_24]
MAHIDDVEEKSHSIIAQSEQHDSSIVDKGITIVSLAPHLTEWVFSLGLGNNLLGVSDYSDYPAAAQSLPRVADYQGADIAAIVALEPDLVLAWEGGNKPQDVQKLTAMGLNVFSTKITHISDIPKALLQLGERTGTSHLASQLATHFLAQLGDLKNKYRSEKPRPVFYYTWSSPLMTVGPNAWANKLLSVCGAKTLFDDSPVDYPQVSVKEVLIRQPDVIVAASHQSTNELENFWAPHRPYIKAPLVAVNPDITSRFSLRLISELNVLCKGINN